MLFIVDSKTYATVLCRIRHTSISPTMTDTITSQTIDFSCLFLLWLP